MRYLFATMCWVLALSSLPLHAQDQPASDQDQPHFAVWEYRVQGNTLLIKQVIERVLYPLLGSDKTAQDVEAARQALARAYSDAGYGTVLVVVPEQEVANGVVKLQVIEGQVEHTYVTGARYFSPVRIRDKLPALADNQVLLLPSLQSQLGALNAVSQDRAVTPVLRPGRTPGTVDVELKVRDRLPLHGSLGINNRYTLNTTHQRLEASLSYNNLWQREHSLSLQYQTAPEDAAEVKVYAGTYVWRPEDGQGVMALYGVRSDSNVATVGALSVIGKGDIVGLRAIYPFADGGQRVTLGADYKDFKDSILQGADSFITPIKYLQFSAQYNVSRRSTGVTNASLAANWGLRGVVNDQAEFAAKRYNARANYFYAKAELEHQRPLWKEAWLRADLKGQWSESPLISNEQFSAGGVESVRGYVESERLGDTAAQINLELHSPTWITPGNRGVQDLHAMLFADAAQLNVKDALPKQESRYNLSGAGVGLHAQAWGGEAVLDVAWPFANAVETRSGDPRVHFSVVYQF